MGGLDGGQEGCIVIQKTLKSTGNQQENIKKSLFSALIGT
jgi:hypothetical protein